MRNDAVNSTSARNDAVDGLDDIIDDNLPYV